MTQTTDMALSLRSSQRISFRARRRSTKFDLPALSKPPNRETRRSSGKKLYLRLAPGHLVGAAWSSSSARSEPPNLLSHFDSAEAQAHSPQSRPSRISRQWTLAPGESRILRRFFGVELCVEANGRKRGPVKADELDVLVVVAPVGYQQVFKRRFFGQLASSDGVVRSRRASESGQSLGPRSYLVHADRPVHFPSYRHPHHLARKPVYKLRTPLARGRSDEHSTKPHVCVRRFATAVCVRRADLVSVA